MNRVLVGSKPESRESMAEIMFETFNIKAVQAHHILFCYSLDLCDAAGPEYVCASGHPRRALAIIQSLKTCLVQNAVSHNLLE
eukprot:2382700-Amphidinium_carterae.1